jgi:hypothetical protein
MKYEPADWHKYTKKQQSEWHTLTYEQRQEIVLKSYLHNITDENGNLDAMKVLECIMNLQDDLEDLKYEVNRLDDNCVKNEDRHYG